jgi:branched-chain amino acid transport system ATP-binding protein
VNDIVLKTERLVKRFGGITATDHVSLNVTRGARHALIGPNGAGKTTLINLMTGVLDPTEGRITLDGKDITRLAPHQRVRRGLVRTFQINQLFNAMTPLETLAMVVSQHRGAGARWWQALGQDRAVAERCAQLLEQFHLTDVMHQRTEHLAYGKRRLLEIGIALACEPRVLLLDEPVAGVPAGEREELLQTVAALPADVSVLLIEHDMDLVFDFARRITVLVNGAVLTEGTPEEIADDPQVKAVYLGHGGRRRAMSDLLQVESLSAGYGEAVVLSDVSFSLAEGETLALLGRNGTGKTTLMDTLAGATRQHGGTIRLGRRDAEPAGVARTRGCGHWLGAAGTQHLQVAHGA